MLQRMYNRQRICGSSLSRLLFISNAGNCEIHLEYLCRPSQWYQQCYFRHFMTVSLSTMKHCVQVTVLYTIFCSYNLYGLFLFYILIEVLGIWILVKRIIHIQFRLVGRRYSTHHDVNCHCWFVELFSIKWNRIDKNNLPGPGGIFGRLGTGTKNQ